MDKKGKTVLIVEDDEKIRKLIGIYLQKEGDEVILNELYPNDAKLVVDRTVDVHVSKLREKLEKLGAEKDTIETIRGREDLLDVWRSVREWHRTHPFPECFFLPYTFSALARQLRLLCNAYPA